MHELSLAEGVLAELEAAARTHAFTRVCRLELEVGVLAGVDLEALRFALDAILPGTLAAAADIQLIERLAQGTCLSCGHTAPLHDRLEPCPACHALGRRATGGTALTLGKLEVE
jgi:hydrogenase nickel incorporation protein HypA/HybF